MSFFTLDIYSIVYAFSELIAAPFKNPGILWFGLPLILTLIIIELNFSSRKEHGIKQALPNALILLFVALDMMRMVFSQEGTFGHKLFSWAFFASFIVLLLAVKIFYIDYKYGFPKRTFFGMSAHMPINIIAYALMVMVYNQVSFDLSFILALLILGALLWLLFFFVRRIGPEEKQSGFGIKKKFSWQDDSRADMDETLDFSRPKRKFNAPTQAPKSAGAKKGEDDSVNLESGNLVWLKK